MVQPRVSGFGGAGSRELGAGAGIVWGAGGGGATRADSRARASSVHPPTANAATSSATSTTRGPRRGSVTTGTVIGGELRPPPVDGSQRSRTTPSSGTSRPIANSAVTPSGASTITPSGSAASCASPDAGRNASSSAPSERSEEHTSELQSPCNLVCRLLLEKKKKKKYYPQTIRKKKKYTIK